MRPPSSDGNRRDDDKALTDAVYRHAFPDAPDESLAGTRWHAIQERLGLGEAPSARDMAKLLGTLRTLGFDRSMRDAVRHRGFMEIGLVLEHASQALSDDIGRGAYNHLLRKESPSSYSRRVRPDQPQHMPSFGNGFARALAQADADIAAIDAAIVAVTGREPPRGRSH